ncbi:MAG: hypothetical protein KAU91_01415 [Candidatus Aminicenantes bacterium]|nr:hypothetical protein [Candidatus Aminicenantes bacterium]
MMKIFMAGKNVEIFLAVILCGSFLCVNSILPEGKNDSALGFLLPDIASWKPAESPQNYFPENLFEYINGAAEIYIAYDFKELIVAQYERRDSEFNVAVEIYDMGNGKNSFGIYSVERYPDNKFISVGTQGYLEDEALNFLVGKYYIKLLCFDCNGNSDDYLKLFAQEIVKKVKDKDAFPVLLKAFPKEGLIPNTEKFFLRNFLGYDFLHDGYLAIYRLENLDFDCFLIEGESEEKTKQMLRQYLDAKNKENIQEIPMGYCFEDRYYHNIYIARVGNYICGVMKIEEGFKEVGKRYLKALIQNLRNI